MIRWVWGITTLLVVVAVFVRLHLGADYTDESQYVAQATGPLLGGQAFATDLLFQQSASLLVTPVAWMYLQLTDSTEGIVLFFRYLYFLIALGVAGLFFWNLRDHLPAPYRGLLALGILAHIPFSIPSPSYNSLGILFLVASLSFAFRLEKSTRLRYGVGLGVFTALAVFSYPTLLLAYLPLGIYLLAVKNYRPAMLVALAVSILIAGLSSILLIQAGPENLAAAYELTRGVSLMDFCSKMNLHGVAFKQVYPGHWTMGILTVLCVGLSLKKWWSPELALILCAFATIPLWNRLGLPLYFSWAIMVVPFLIVGELLNPRLFSGKFLKLRNLILLVPIIAGLATGWSSGNGLFNAALGFSVAALCFFVVYFERPQKITVLAWLSCLMIWSLSLYQYVYREAASQNLTTQVQSGPFQGMYTTANRAAWLDTLNNDLMRLPPQAQSILFFDQFPAGYLFTQLQPKTFLYFMHPTYYTPWLRPKLVSFFSESQNLPDVVVQMFVMPLGDVTVTRVGDSQTNILNDPFWDFFAKHPNYREVLRHNSYAIFIRKGILN